MKENRKLLKEVIKGIKRDMTDEDVLNLLADSKVSENPNREKDKYTVGQRAADAIAKFAGSWAFIFSFAGLLILWMLANVLLAAKAFESLSVHFAEPCLIMCGSSSSSPHNDESEQAGRKGQAQSRKRL